MRCVPACRGTAESGKVSYRCPISKKGCRSLRRRRAISGIEERKSRAGRTIGACRLGAVSLPLNLAKMGRTGLLTSAAARSDRREEIGISVTMRAALRLATKAGNGLPRGEGGRLRVATVCSRTAETLADCDLLRVIVWSSALRAMPRLTGVTAVPSGPVERCEETLRPISGRTAPGPQTGAAIGPTSAVAPRRMPVATLPTSSSGTTVATAASCPSQMGLRISAETTRSGRPATRGAPSGREGRMPAFSGTASSLLAVCAAGSGLTTASIGSVQLGREVHCSRFCRGRVLSAGS